jgi:hypothetical protein
MIKRYDTSHVRANIDGVAIQNYEKKYGNAKYLITNTDLNINNFIKLESIDDIDSLLISNSLFFLHFISDDEYIYHLDKIISNNGKYLIQMNYDKHNYVHSNKKCNMALTDTIRCNNEISHYNEIIHGNICQALEQTRHLEGDYVEIGVYKGGSALTALNYMKHSKIIRKSYLFDTFDGFDYDEATNSFETHWEKNNNHHKLFGIENTKKYIQNILTRECPESDFILIESNICRDELPSDIKNIVVANIDVDIFDATRDALNKVAIKIVKGGIIIAEDPTSTPGLIGAFYAMEKFLDTPLGKKFMKLHLVGQYFLIKIYD